MLLFYLILVVASSLAIVSVALPSAASAILSTIPGQSDARADQNVWFTSNVPGNNAGRARVFATNTYFLFEISASPDTQTISQGQSVTYTVSVVHSGPGQTVQLAVIIPAGLSSSFNPSTGTPDFTSTLTINYPSSTSVPTGSYPLTIQAYSPSCSGVCDPSQKNPTTFTITLIVQQQTTTTTSPTVTTTCDHNIYVHNLAFHNNFCNDDDSVTFHCIYDEHNGNKFQHLHFIHVHIHNRNSDIADNPKLLHTLICYRHNQNLHFVCRNFHDNSPNNMDE